MTLLQNFGSFRDPSGSVFDDGTQILRSVHECYSPHYDKAVGTGLFKNLIEKGWLIPFEESDQSLGAWKTLQVERIPFISYPYEWSFKQLKDAAVLTLRIQQEALKHGMTLKDATAFNVQFYKGKPTFIDILSFEEYKEGTPWIAYRQYISHFLGPLLLMRYNDVRQLSQFRNFIDGIPIDYISKNLPLSTRFSPSILINIHWHAKLLKKHESTKSEQKTEVRPISRSGLDNMIAGLLTMVRGINPPKIVTEWGDYYNDTNYDNASFKRKGEIVSSICRRILPKMACDLGANLGEFSRILAQHAGTVISPDIDPVAVNRNYTLVRDYNETNIFPLVQDLCNPSPGIGWMNEERTAFLQRAKCDLVTALALIHHLCIGNNVPMEYVARMLREIAPNAVVEFVPKEDSQVKRLLSSREDIFPDYHLQHCVDVFLKYYKSVEQYPVEGTLRTILVFAD